MSGTNGDRPDDKKRPAHLRNVTLARLAARGLMHDTFDTVVTRVLDELEAFERQQQPIDSRQLALS